MLIKSPENLELRHLRYFLAVASELHFGRAAQLLNIVQPALSMQIKALEGVLGVRLFNRTNRHVELTEAGRIFFHEAKMILEKVDHAALLASRAGAGEIGQLNIGFSGNSAYSGVLSSTVRSFRQQYPQVDISLNEMSIRSQLQGLQKSQLLASRAGAGEIGQLNIGFSGNSAYSGVLSSTVRSFRQQYPQVDISLNEMSIRSQLQGLQKSQLDIGYVTLYSVSIPESIKIAQVGAWPWMIALPSDHAMANQEIIDLALLADETFFVFTDSESNFELLPILQKICGFIPEKIKPVRNAMAIMTMIAGGLGVSILPETLSRIKLENIIYRKLPKNDQTAKLAVACRIDEDNPIIENFLRLAMKKTNN
ncbi:LysR substrate-binding domain-containing protein [Sodalis sp. RH18]|uniref:LysR substrate-binding domain-containing protein n=1 Tax=Sodalis sp. RH18 TaxID=3394333 RepID=UPI0039B67682